MKRMFVSVVLVALLVATSYAGSGSKSETDIAYKKRETPKRQGWSDNEWGGLFMVMLRVLPLPDMILPTNLGR